MRLIWEHIEYALSVVGRGVPASNCHKAVGYILHLHLVDARFPERDSYWAIYCINFLVFMIKREAGVPTVRRLRLRSAANRATVSTSALTPVDTKPSLGLRWQAINKLQNYRYHKDHYAYSLDANFAKQNTYTFI